jgi:hypothetical protein
MKQLLIISSLLICFSLGAMSQSKHHHIKKKHHRHLLKKDDTKSDSNDKTNK